MNPTIKEIVKLLESANPDKPWMTAKRIAEKIKEKIHIPSEEIQKLLLDHISEAWQENESPKIRYSNLPSKKTLQVLWAAVSQPKVGMRSLKPLARTDQIDEPLSGIEFWDSANIFFSHSHKDYDKVIRIATSLVQSGFSPWLAETHINWGDYINDEIETALSRADAFLLFLSTNAINSRWTEKEYGFAVKNLRIPIFVVADNDESIHNLVCKLANDKEASSSSDNLSGVSRDFYESLRMHRHETKYFKLEQFDSAIDLLALDSIVRPFNEQSSKLEEVLPRPRESD